MNYMFLIFDMHTFIDVATFALHTLHTLYNINTINHLLITMNCQHNIY